MKRIALLPAAGSGSRVGASCPKQYLDLNGEPLMAHTIRALCAAQHVDQVVVVLSPEDEWFESFAWPSSPKLRVLRCGGASRAETVRNGLQILRQELLKDAWVLVHDAARPCIEPQSVDALIDLLSADAVGGLLAVPVADTVKRADADGRVGETVPRAHLWRAQTPQMFRLLPLLDALSSLADASITDESSAMEQAGYAPRLVMGTENNIKVTFPEDLQRAADILNKRHLSSAHA
ncbi:2-C-methyl-D-erythritol 4-phosphate cytidylyltransferase [Burkholderiaceae bacterium DAT-1]|nr:2-C-methyl-D-erythritol 4-phosphate cytidylyltransferase [Burkholderiaceae bacterium DAT-1]